MCLSTCNRTELYAVGDDAEQRSLEALRSARRRRGRGALYRLDDHAAALHLFRVAAGLDSLVPGEGEILGQVRAAYEAGAPGSLLNRLFHDALHAGKKRACADDDRGEPGVGFVRRRGARAAGVRRPERTARADRRRRQGRRACRAQPRGARSGARRGRRIVPTSAADELARAYRCDGRADSSGSRTSSRHADVAVACTSAPGFLIGPRGRPRAQGAAALPHRPRRAARHRSGRERASTAVTSTTSTISRRSSRRAFGTAPRGRARRGDRRGGGGAVPRVAGVARRRSDDRVVACARRGDPLGGAVEGEAERPRACGRRVDHVADREQAPASARRCG